MKKIIAVLCGVVGLFASAAAQDPYEPMAFFAKLDGMTLRGEGVGPDGKPIVDIARYEMILGGRAFQSTHRLEDGSYGGRSIFFYDEGAEQYIFHYFTTAGFHTTGSIEMTETGFTSVEKVAGHESIVVVRSEMIFGEDEVRVSPSYVDKDGAVSAAEERIYRPIDDPGPLFE